MRICHSPFFLLSHGALLILAMLRPDTARAHGDVHERITQLSVQIDGQPDNAELRLQRAELYRQHAQFDEALADLTITARLKPDASIVHLAKARVLGDAGNTTNALDAVEKFLALEPNHPGGLVIRARCRLKSGQVDLAVVDFTRAIAGFNSPEPDLFIERARAQAARGQLAAAVNGLDEGMNRIGAVPQLQLVAIEYERQRAAFTNALARVDKLLAGQPVKEPWLVLHGEILAQSGELQQARATFHQILDGVELYPPVRRNLEQTRELEKRVRENLARVETRLQTNARISSSH